MRSNATFSTQPTLWPERLATTYDFEYREFHDSETHWLAVEDTAGIVPVRGGIDDAIRAARAIAHGTAVAVLAAPDGFAIARLVEHQQYEPGNGHAVRPFHVAVDGVDTSTWTDVDPRLIAIVDGVRELRIQAGPP